MILGKVRKSRQWAYRRSTVHVKGLAELFIFLCIDCGASLRLPLLAMLYVQRVQVRLLCRGLVTRL